MAKSAAQRAARNRRRKAKNARVKNGSFKPKQGPKRGPIFLNPVPKGKRLGSLRRMVGAGPSSVRVNTGKLGLSMGSGMRPGATNRRQKYCEEDEFIANISGSSSTTAFTIAQTLAVNPGQALTFPWMAPEASRYNEYEFEYLEFYYKRTVSEFGTAGTQGKVLLYFDTDATGPAPVTKQQIEDSVYHNDGMPCDPVIRLPIDVSRLRKNDSKYVRTGAQPANTDLKTFDAGNFYCAVDSTANTSTIGELRVRYRVKFTCPILTSAASTGGVAHFSSLAPTTANALAGMTLQVGNTPALSGITASGNTITFPSGIPGNYLVSYQAIAGTSAGAIAYNSVTGGVSLLALFTSAATRDIVAIAQSLASTTNNWTMINVSVGVTNAGGTLVFTPGTIVGSAGADLFVTVLPVTVLTAQQKERVDVDKLTERADAQDRKISELIRMLTHCSTPVPDSDYENERTIIRGEDVCLNIPEECKESASSSSKKSFSTIFRRS